MIPLTENNPCTWNRFSVSWHTKISFRRIGGAYPMPPKTARCPAIHEEYAQPRCEKRAGQSWIDHRGGRAFCTANWLGKMVQREVCTSESVLIYIRNDDMIFCMSCTQTKRSKKKELCCEAKRIVGQLDAGVVSRQIIYRERKREKDWILLRCWTKKWQIAWRSVSHAVSISSLCEPLRSCLCLGDRQDTQPHSTHWGDRQSDKMKYKYTGLESISLKYGRVCRSWKHLFEVRYAAGL